MFFFSRAVPAFFSGLRVSMGFRLGASCTGQPRVVTCLSYLFPRRGGCSVDRLNLWSLGFFSLDLLGAFPGLLRCKSLLCRAFRSLGFRPELRQLVQLFESHFWIQQQVSFGNSLKVDKKKKHVLNVGAAWVRLGTSLSWRGPESKACCPCEMRPSAGCSALVCQTDVRCAQGFVLHQLPERWLLQQTPQTLQRLVLGTLTRLQRRSETFLPSRIARQGLLGVPPTPQWCLWRCLQPCQSFLVVLRIHSSCGRCWLHASLCISLLVGRRCRALQVLKLRGWKLSNLSDA